ncbi:cystathionine beta-lyase [Limnohabitans sp. Jir61]|uniref:PLP-dependent transferase n=1 Tax=Limnohabitans sp. Jir61 TaxID=1826168 RepID=UPI000D3CAA71|nr:PLP-dependent transferase [Limnohabitans sp. Jir61]PUE32948.1 cystathionine beta-lyase [Limnohabitans sp. Jir61]
MTRSTDLIHHAYLPPAEFEAPQVGVFKASTVIFPNVAAMRTREWMDKSAYTYGLHGTPTTFTLEERLATLEGGTHCILTPSGLAAIAHVDFALLKTGDEVLIPDNAYAPNKSLAEGELAQFGVTHQVYDPLDVNDLAALITPRTRLVWLEAAGSVTMEFPDLVAMVQLCKARGVLCALDNTWGAGLAFNAFDLTPGQCQLGVDLTIHALTKYPSGGGDVLMGSIVTRSDELARVLKLTHMRLGTGVGANDAEMVLRSLASMPLRYKAQDMAARTLAAWCASQPAFSQVLHPALSSSPGHAHWQDLCVSPQEPEGLAAGIFSVVMDARFPAHAVDAFCDSLKLFKIGYSWGGPMSLVMPYNMTRSRAHATSHLQRGCVVRFCIGLEDVNDLQKDISQALNIAKLQN